MANASFGYGYPAMDYDPDDQQVYLFGGGYSDVWSYDVPSKTWTRHTPTGDTPPPRDRSAFANDTLNHVFLMFGGATSDGTWLNDTYLYDPARNTWTLLAPSQPGPTAYTYSYMTYDPDDNAFILAASGHDGFAAGTYNHYGVQTWLFRYQGGGPNIGAATATPQPPPGSLNRNADAWAKEPSLASDGTTLWAARSETGKPFDLTNSGWTHAQASQLSGSTWNAMGSSALAIDSESDGYNESHAPSLAMINGVPWLTWYRVSNGGPRRVRRLRSRRWLSRRTRLRSPRRRGDVSTPSQGAGRAAPSSGSPHVMARSSATQPPLMG